MSSDAAPARRERGALCDLFVEVGPDAPTLCGDWTTRDLAAHLVMRERRPDGALGIVFSKAAAHADKVQAKIAATEWSELVETVRSGPPLWSPTKLAPIDKLANTVEFFVHHEDVRRAADPWAPRRLDDDLTADLEGMLRRMARRLVASSPVGIALEPTDGSTPIVAKDTDPSVDVRGTIGELVLFVFGRQTHADVQTHGDAAAITAAMNASFGL